MARRTILALAVLLAAAPLVAQEGGIFADKPKAKSPIPGEAARKEALRLVGEVYKADYDAAKTSEEKQTLARKLLQAAGETSEPASRYVLLDVACDVAARAADVDLAFEAADALAAAYQVDVFGKKYEALEAASRAADSPALLKGVVEGALALVDEAAARDDFETTARLGRFAVAAARRTRDPKVVNQVIRRNRQIDRAAQAYRKVKVAKETLEASPGDPKANQTVGHYLCLVKGDWEKGLPMLALGSDAALKTLAVQELQSVTDAKAQAALGDGWWDLAQAEQGPAKEHLEARAKLWYTKALPNLTGLLKTKVQQRLEEEKEEAVVAKPAKKPDHYLEPDNLKNVAFVNYINESRKDDARGLFRIEKVDTGYRVVCANGGGAKFKWMVFPNENVVAKALVVSFTVEGGECYVGFRSRALHSDGPMVGTFGPRTKCHVRLWIENGVGRAVVNGQPSAIRRNNPAHHGFFTIGIADGSTLVVHELRFETLQGRRRQGSMAPQPETPGSRHE